MKNIISKTGLMATLFMIPNLVLAASENADPNFYTKLAGNIIGIVGGLLIFATLAFLVNLLNQIIRLREIQIYQENGLEPFLDAKKSNEGSWITKLYKQLTASVPIEKEKDILLNHNYDGIQELDNNLPPWWVYGFYLTIGIAIFYVGYYQFSSNAKSSAELYAIEMEQSEAAVDRFLATQANRVDESNVEPLTEAAALAEGKGTFETYCAACHSQTGGGSPTSVGPNLTDKYWLHGGGIKNVFKTIKYGVPAKGMISWKDQLRPTEIHKVASYILSIQGSNPPNAKDPQGDLYEGETNSTEQ